jgi:predicted  nucleic acid-binding Zn-ribbon protein
LFNKTDLEFEKLKSRIDILQQELVAAKTEIAQLQTETVHKADAALPLPAAPRIKRDARH